MAIFVRAVELGGFATAAKEADISATMVAKHVNSLETRLGARLLNRTTRRQSLTEVGKLYYDRCKTLLAEVDAAESSVSALRATEKHGRLEPPESCAMKWSASASESR
jgi:DNA-binding transcriptional LysR family regulator